MRLRWPLIIACLVWALSVPASPAVGGGGLTATPDQLRALYVQRLVKYVTWPDGSGPGPHEPFIIAAVKPDLLRPYFDTPEARDRFQIVQWPAEHCHALVLIGALQREAAAILKREAGNPLLTITQNPAHLRQGAVVNFYQQGGKLRLEINPAAAESAGLSISSRLLQLARIYKGGDDG